jgi:hypothetical protein
MPPAGQAAQNRPPRFTFVDPIFFEREMISLEGSLMENDPAHEDPLVEGCIEDALAPYQSLLPPGVLGDFREVLGLLLTGHPVLAPMVDSLRARPIVASSGEMDRAEHGSAVPAVSTPPSSRRASGGTR